MFPFSPLFTLFIVIYTWKIIFIFFNYFVDMFLKIWKIGNTHSVLGNLGHSPGDK